MKCIIAFSCVLAVASAGYLNSVAPLAYANHGTHAVAYNAPLVSAPHPVHVGYAGPLAHGYAAPIAHGYAAHAVAPIVHRYTHGYAHGLASEARLIDPVAIAAGAPLPGGDTFEVAAAKAFHHQAHVEAKTGHLLAKSLAYSAPIAHGLVHAAPIAHGYAHGYAHAAPITHAGLLSEARLIDPVAIAAGAPLPGGDTVEVAAAKAFHHQAHVEAKTGHLLAKSLTYSAPIAYGYVHTAPIAHGYAHAGLFSEARLIDPVAIAAGAPLPTGDTVEVAAAKAAHAQAHHAAKAGHYLVKRSPGYLNAAVVAAPLSYAAPVSYAVAAPAHSYSYSSQITHAAPVHSYGVSTYAGPLAYAGHSGYLGAYYG